jgi:serine/threonine protein kinase
VVTPTNTGGKEGARDGNTAIVNRTSPTGSGSAAVPTSDLVFGRYQIIRRLAVGGMGEVFLARQSSVAGFDRLIILKSLLPDLADQKDFVDQFLDEARVAATLNHPNIVSIYEVGQWNGTYFIAMEYIRGDNLSRLQRAAERARRAIPLDVAAFIIHDAAHALDHAHKAVDIHGKAQNIVHRDVSPQNIMVRTDGVTKVVDFGIAKAANRSSRTATGLLKGKVQYMAPEQVSGMDLDGRADQFALGVTLWEMVAGRKLFTGNNDIDVLRAVIQAPIPPLAGMRADVPPQLGNVVDKMLARDRDARYPTLAEAAADLKKFLDLAGMKHVQEHTAAFVADMLGEEISAKTVDLTPSSANNFVINLSAPSTSPTSMNAGGRIPRRAKIGIAAGVSVALVLSVLTAAIVFMPEPTSVTPIAVSPVRANPQLAVETQPTGAAVKVDGVEVGKTPVTVDVTADVEHTVTVDAPGYETRTEQLKLAAGQMKPFVFVLAKKQAKISVRALLDGAPVDGVEVKSGGKVLGKTPFEVVVAPDDAIALVAGMKRGKDTFAGGASAKAAPGEMTRIDIKLAKVNVAIACPKGTKRSATGGCEEVARETNSTSIVPATGGKGLLTLDTKPWAKLYIDGKYVDSTPLSKYELSAGVHTLRMVNEASGVDEQRKITIKAGETFKATWQLKTN